MSSGNLNNTPENGEEFENGNDTNSVTYSEAITIFADLINAPVPGLILAIDDILTRDGINSTDNSEGVLSASEVNVTPTLNDSASEAVPNVTGLSDSVGTTILPEVEDLNTSVISEQSGLAKIEVTPTNPIHLFKTYFEEAEKYSKSIVPVFSLASVGNGKEILNRNLILRGYDDNGFMFACERNSRKYQDFMENPNVAATFLWTYKKLDSENFTYHQVRINGYVRELNEKEIQKLYEKESLSAKIRIKICVSSKVTEWKQLKRLHDDVLKNYKKGIDKLEQPLVYVGFRIIPKTIDFFHTEDNFIPDRVLYTRNFISGRWSHCHVCA